jgi:HSP20 family molecular chaperone IbpA
MATLSREGRGSRDARRSGVGSPGQALPAVPVKRLRQWRYQTLPSFKRVRGPLVDVFSEAEEVLIVVDLGGFTRGEISLNMTPTHYTLEARRGGQWFREVIDLPQNVDLERARERLVNGVLEVVLPRQRRIAPRRAARDTGGGNPQ